MFSRIMAAGIAIILSASVATAQSKQRVSVTDRTFVRKAAMGGTAEVELGRLASQRGGPATQQFASRMIQDHTMGNQQLMQVASSAGIEAPASISHKHGPIMDQLATLSGPAFDQAYAQAMVQDHVETVELFERASRDATNPGIRSFAQQQLPILQQHLQHAQSLAAQTSANAPGPYAPAQNAPYAQGPQAQNMQSIQGPQAQASVQGMHGSQTQVSQSQQAQGQQTQSQQTQSQQAQEGAPSWYTQSPFDPNLYRGAMESNMCSYGQFYY